MTNEEAIKFICEIRKDHLDQVPNAWGTRSYYEIKSPQIKALDMAIEALKQTQWTPCSEKLPEMWKDILLSIGGSVYEAHLRESEKYFVTHRDTRFIRAEEPIAWMPLPKPWEGEIK